MQYFIAPIQMSTIYGTKKVVQKHQKVKNYKLHNSHTHVHIKISIRYYETTSTNKTDNLKESEKQ